MSKLEYIPLNKIRQNSVALRDVDKASESFIGLVDSIRNEGVLNPINVRSFKDPDSGEDLFSIVDGLHRYTASLEAGKDSIPAQILTHDASKDLMLQLIANVHKVETKPVEYSRQLTRILAADPLLTIPQLATTLGKSGTWLGERLGLTKLVKAVEDKVDGGLINLSNAYLLAKLPQEVQGEFVDMAMQMTPQEFGPKVLARKKELDKAKREGRDPNAAAFNPMPHLQKLSSIKEEVASSKIGPQLVKVMKLDKVDSKTEAAEKGFLAGLNWVLHMDPLSIEVAKAEHDKHVSAVKAKKDAAAAERLKKQQERKDIESARLKIHSDTLAAGGDVTAALKAFDDKHGLVDGKKPAPAPVAVVEESK